MKKAIFALFLACLMVISLAGCGSSVAAHKPEETEPSSVSTSSESQSTPKPTESAPSEVSIPEEPTPDYSEVYAKYLEILQGNKQYIDLYDWQQGDGPIAFADIVDDPTPELIYLWVARGGNTAALSGCVYRDGEVSIIYYNHIIDEQAGAGVRYCLFRSADDILYLYRSQGGDPWIYSFTEYSVDPLNGYVPSETLTHEVSPSADHTTSSHKYMLDNTEISAEEYEFRTQEIIDKMGTVVVWSGEEEDQAIWDKVSELGSAAMTYDEAVAFLEANITSVDVPSAPPENTPAPAIDGEFTEEQAIDLVVPLVISEFPEAALNEGNIADLVDFSVAKSDKLYDDQPIYLVDYMVFRVGAGRALAFADGTVLGSSHPEYKNYNGYFDIDITAP